jgi:hypothetical protein
MTARTSISLTAAACLLLPAAALAQSASQFSGTSHPELLNDNLTTSTVSDDGTHYVKPSPAVPAPQPSLQVRPDIDATPAAAPQTYTASTADDDHYTPTPHRDPNLVTDDINSGIVTDVHVASNQLAPATTLRAQLDQNISTKETIAGTRFTATLTADVGHDGRVLLPAGTVVHGRITQIHGGRRISGNAAIRLQPDYVVLPDGTTYKLHAEVTDLDHFQDSHVNSEGTIVANGHPKATAAALGLTTGSAVIAGAMIGGGVGAVVGLGVGAGIGAVWRRDRQEALPRGTEIAFTLNESLFVGQPAH